MFVGMVEGGYDSLRVNFAQKMKEGGASVEPTHKKKRIKKTLGPLVIDPIVAEVVPPPTPPPPRTMDTAATLSASGLDAILRREGQVAENLPLVELLGRKLSW